jgi:outer membrane protein assembly factor BamB
MTALRLVMGKGAPAAPASTPSSRGTVDLLVDGTNLTARLPEVDRANFLEDLSRLTDDLCERRNHRVAARCHAEEGPWELGLERDGRDVLVTLFRGGPRPEVVLFERRVDLAAFASVVGCERGRTVSQVPPSDDVLAAPLSAEPALLEVATESDTVVRLSATFGLRPRIPARSLESTVERADLFSLLVRGTLSIAIGERLRTFPETFVFLFAEQLLGLASESFDAWEQGRSYNRRSDLGGISLGIRSVADTPGIELDPDSTLSEPGTWLTLGVAQTGANVDARTFRVPDGASLAEGAVSFGRALARALLRHDPGQKQNLRLSAFRSALRSLDERLRDVTRDDVKVNPKPDAYRTTHTPLPSPPAVARDASKLRFSPNWTASFGGIDLRSTFLCGDRLVVGASRETACLDRRTGDVLWRRPTQPAVSVVTPEGLARLFPDGSIALHDFGSGDIVVATRVAPRVGGVVTGAVVSAPGLPRLLVVSEGKRRLSAIDLTTGEARWRHTSHGGAMFRLRRAGKLLVVVAGDATLTALDIASGDVVWRTRDRLRFKSHVGLDHDSLFALAGEPGGRGAGAFRLHHLDPYAGATRWVRDLAPGVSPIGAPLVTDREVVLVTRDRRGLGLLALDRAGGDELWSSEPGRFPVASAWLTIDDAVVMSSERGDLLSLATRTGAVQWRHRFPRGMEGDQPRKLEPILRSGALFVPQQQVHVVRPRDGAVLGVVPTNLIPDLLRVDENCDVYVAEESGHIAAFRAGAKLSLV